MPSDQPKPTPPRTAATGDSCHRLPCRGCLPDCSDYAACEGRPWRMPASKPRAHDGAA